MAETTNGGKLVPVLLIGLVTVTTAFATLVVNNLNNRVTQVEATMQSKETAELERKVQLIQNRAACALLARMIGERAAALGLALTEQPPGPDDLLNDRALHEYCALIYPPEVR